LITLSLILLLAILLADISIFLKGREVWRDFWAPASEYYGLGIVFWFLTFPVASLKLLDFVRRKISRSRILYFLGISFSLICYFFFGLSVCFLGRSDIPVVNVFSAIVKIWFQQLIHFWFSK
jgi:hypothetical protein